MIHRFRVQNFRSITDVSVDLSPVTVLVGKSGTGKSNFVESIRFLRDVLSAHPQMHPQMHILQQKWPQSRPATMPNGDPGFEVEFSIAGVDEKFTYELTRRSEEHTSNSSH